LAGKLPFDAQRQIFRGSVTHIHLDKPKSVQMPGHEAIHARIFLQVQAGLEAQAGLGKVT